MYLTDLITKHFGSDKVMHYLGGAWITALASPFGGLGISIAFIIILCLSFIKEKWLDETFDWYDILAAFVGSLSTILIYVLIQKIFLI